MALVRVGGKGNDAGGRRRAGSPQNKAVRAVDTAERIVAATAIEGVVAVVAAEQVESVPADQRIVAGATVERVGATQTVEGVVARQPGNRVIALAPGQRVVACGAGYTRVTVLHGDVRRDERHAGPQVRDEQRGALASPVRVVEKLSGRGVVDDAIGGIVGRARARRREKTRIVGGEVA